MIVENFVKGNLHGWCFGYSPDGKETGKRFYKNGIELTLPRFIFASSGNWDIGKKGLNLAAEVDLDMTTDGQRNVLLKTKQFIKNQFPEKLLQSGLECCCG